MKRVTVMLFMFLFSVNSFAYLPPNAQRIKDLDVMTNFVKSHLKVVITLKSIDFEHFTIYFDEDCKALFGRKVIPRPSNGPALLGGLPDLEFKSSNCSLDW